MKCAADNCNYMCHICAKFLHICDTYNCDYLQHVCAKEFLDSNFNWAVIDKISNFQEIAPNFTYSQKS